MHKFVLVTLLLTVSMACARAHSEPADSVAKTEGVKTIKVTVAAAVVKPVQSALEVSGTFFPLESSDIAPQTSGVVSEVNAEIGRFVKKDQVLARLDDRNARLRLQEAEAAEQQALAALRQAEERIGAREKFEANEVPEVRAARAALESAQSQAKLAGSNAQRYAHLADSGVISRSVYDQVRTQLETAEAQVRMAQQQHEAALNFARQSNQGVASARAAVEVARAQVATARKELSDTVIKAPFDGYISDRPAAVGEYVTSQSKIATIQNISILKLALLLPEAEAARVKIGDAITAKVAAFPNREFVGKIAAIAPSLETSSRALVLQVGLRNEELLLRPGMFVTARVLQTEAVREGVFVPRAAVVNDADTSSTYVYVVDKNVARVRVVQLGTPDGELMHIVTGIKGGEQVVTGNLADLYDGAVIEVQ